uniref:Uncharacterized protein n=1 Tax=Rhizophora mucronata TaxID=61149 RepID=A0A2P2IVV5_RHIMU
MFKIYASLHFQLNVVYDLIIIINMVIPSESLLLTHMPLQFACL